MRDGPQPVVFALTPVDTLFFRSGRPYNQDDPGAALAESLFPPNPPTVVGAVRAALAGLLGWDGRGTWPAEITDLLGDGDDLGPLTFRGPYLMRRPRLSSETGQKKWDRLFPIPACFREVKEATGASRIIRLRPSPQTLHTDMGWVTLPVPDTVDENHAYKELAGRWLLRPAMQDVIGRKDPNLDALIPSTDLWTTEQRIGIARNNTNRCVEPGALYMAGHVLANPGYVEDEQNSGSGFSTEIAVAVDGLDVAVLEALAKRDGDLGTVPLGGEHRAVWMRTVGRKDAEALTHPKGGKGSGGLGDTPKLVVAIAQTPVIGTDPAWLRPDGTLGDDLPIRTVSAGKATSIGGWDSVARRPLPQRPVLPPGTTWHVKNLHKATLGSLPKALGDRQDWGFGEVLWCADVG